MPAYRKVAVTIPAETYAALEAARKRLGKTRSAAVSAAIDEWLRGLEASAQSERYVAGYLKLPETDDGAVLVEAATADWSAWRPGAASRAAEPRARRK